MEAIKPPLVPEVFLLVPGFGPSSELELELIQTHMTQKPVLRVDVGACRFAQQSTAKNFDVG